MTAAADKPGREAADAADRPPGASPGGLRAHARATGAWRAAAGAVGLHAAGAWVLGTAMVAGAHVSAPAVPPPVRVQIDLQPTPPAPPDAPVEARLLEMPPLRMDAPATRPRPAAPETPPPPQPVRMQAPVLPSVLTSADGVSVDLAPGGTVAPADWTPAGVPDGLDADLPPSPGDIRRPAYPLGARQRGEEGAVGLAIAVDARGAVTEVTVRHSSGFPELDHAAAAALRQARFAPARRGGVAVPSSVQLNVVFRLTD